MTQLLGYGVFLSEVLTSSRRCRSPWCPSWKRLQPPPPPPPQQEEAASPGLCCELKVASLSLSLPLKAALFFASREERSSRRMEGIGNGEEREQKWRKKEFLFSFALLSVCLLLLLLRERDLDRHRQGEQKQEDIFVYKQKKISSQYLFLANCLPSCHCQYGQKYWNKVAKISRNQNLKIASMT